MMFGARSYKNELEGNLPGEIGAIGAGGTSLVGTKREYGARALRSDSSYLKHESRVRSKKQPIRVQKRRNNGEMRGRGADSFDIHAAIKSRVRQA
jgi:hypothetical protein